MLAGRQIGTWWMQNCTTDKQALIGMSACWYVGTSDVYIYKTRVGGRYSHVGMLAGWQVSTWRMKNCTTAEQSPVGMSALKRSRVGEDAGMSAGRHFRGLYM